MPPDTQPAERIAFGSFELEISSSELFKKGRRVRLSGQSADLLTILVTRGGKLVSREELRQALWPEDTFVDFDHGLNNCIRRIRDALGDSAESPRYIETLPKKGYRFIAETHPVLLLKSVAADQTETKRVDFTGSDASPSRPVEVPLEKEIELTPDPVVTLQPRRYVWLAMIIATTMAAGVLGFTIDQNPLAGRFLPRNTAKPITSIAVLPLDNLSGDPGQEYFADGMTDELITMLAKDSTLRVTSRTSVMQYKRANRPLTEIARALNVDAILEGSVSRSSNQVHMTIQLIRADTDAHLWADSYDRDNHDAAQLPDEAARQVAGYLHKTSSATVPVRFVNSEAHDAYLRGLYFWFTAKNGEAGKYFRKATELQPDYALAWSGLSSYFGVGAIGGFQDPRLSVPQLKFAALRAVQLDDSLPETHLALSMAYLCEWNINGAQSEVDRALQLNPSLAEAYHLRARINTAINRNAQAIEAQRRAMELDPFERPWGMVWTLKTARQYDAALKEAQERLKGLPNDDSLYWELGQVYDRKGDRDKAVQAWEKMELSEGHTSNATTMRRVYQQGGWTALIKRFIADAQKESAGSYVSPFDLARYHAQLSEREQTFSLLNEAYRQHSPQLLWIQTDPAFDFLHSDPRYHTLIRQVGVPPGY
jgi:TolB-like protein/DNA-binding winged helix-turn-helix (wHTH) protein